MRTESETKITADPKVFAAQKYPTTFLFGLLIEEGVAPVKWKCGKAPTGRDATPKDLDTQAAVRTVGNEVQALW